MPFGLIGSTGPSQLDYTAARAALLDRLALLEAGGAGELTIAGAALLPNLNAAITSRLADIKNIQSALGTIAAGAATTNTAITAVVIAKTILIDLGAWVTTSAATDTVVRHRLTSTTNLETIRGGTTLAVNFHCMIVEFN